MAMLTIAGQAVPSPCLMKLVYLDVRSDEKRNALGEAVIDRTAVKRGMDLSWARLTAAELAALFQAAGGETVFFEVTFPDADGTAGSMTAFAAEKSAKLLSVQDGVTLWTDVKLTLREK